MGFSYTWDSPPGIVPSLYAGAARMPAPSHLFISSSSPHHGRFTARPASGCRAPCLDRARFAPRRPLQDGGRRRAPRAGWHEEDLGSAPESGAPSRGRAQSRILPGIGDGSSALRTVDLLGPPGAGQGGGRRRGGGDGLESGVRRGLGSRGSEGDAGGFSTCGCGGLALPLSLRLCTASELGAPGGWRRALSRDCLCHAAHVTAVLPATVALGTVCWTGTVF